MMKLTKKAAYQTMNYYDHQGEWLKSKFVVQILRQCVKDDIVYEWLYWGDDLIEIYLSQVSPNRIEYSKRTDRVPSDEVGLYGTKGGFKKVISKSFRFDRRCDKTIRKILRRD